MLVAVLCKIRSLTEFAFAVPFEKRSTLGVRFVRVRLLFGVPEPPGLRLTLTERWCRVFSQFPSRDHLLHPLLGDLLLLRLVEREVVTVLPCRCVVDGACECRLVGSRAEGDGESQ